MMTVKYFDIRDVFRAPRAGLSGKKVWVAFNGILLAYIGYAVFTYLSRVAIGMSFSGIWASQGLWPIPACAHYNWAGWVLSLIGTLFAGVVLLITALAVCRLAYQQLKGDDFYASSDAWAFARKQWGTVILAPLAILALIFFFVVSGWILALIGKIPAIGPVVVALSMPLTIFFAMLVALIAIVLHVHFTLGPAIAACTGGDTMDVIVQLFSCVWSQPWRFLFYEILLKFLTVFAVHVLVIFLMAGLWIIRWVMTPVMGVKLQQMFHIGYELARFRCPAVTMTHAWCWRACGKAAADALPSGMRSCLDVLFGADLSGVGGATIVAGNIFGVVLFLVMLTVAAYFFATWFSGQSIIYLILRQRKDDENLLEREDEEDWEEELEEEPAPAAETAEIETPESPPSEASSAEDAIEEDSTEEDSTEK